MLSVCMWCFFLFYFQCLLVCLFVGGHSYFGILLLFCVAKVWHTLQQAPWSSTSACTCTHIRVAVFLFFFERVFFFGHILIVTWYCGLLIVKWLTEDQTNAGRNVVIVNLFVMWSPWSNYYPYCVYLITPLGSSVDREYFLSVWVTIVLVLELGHCCLTSVF